jgi:hypothetical protein
MRTQRVIRCEPLSRRNCAGLARLLDREKVTGRFLLVEDGRHGQVHAIAETDDGEVFSWLVGYGWDGSTYSPELSERLCEYRHAERFTPAKKDPVAELMATMSSMVSVMAACHELVDGEARP